MTTSVPVLPSRAMIVRPPLAMVLALGLALAACGREVAPADAAAAPAPAGGLRLETVIRKLDRPSFVTHAGDERLFVTLIPGRIVILRDGKLAAGADGSFLDIRDRVSAGGERGLLSVAFHPKYRENGLFFVNYTNRAGDTEIARFRVSTDDPDRADPRSGVVLLEIQQPYSNHNGGQLQFGPDGYLYVGMGDGGAGGDPHCNGQRPAGLLAKMLRLDVDAHAAEPPYYGIPADNPFRGPGDPADEVWAVGLRNPWRFSFDRSTGDLWIGDVGQNEIEEVDFVERGKGSGANFGWNVKEGTRCFSSSCSSEPCRSNRFVDPVVEYDHGRGDCSVTGGYVYRGQGVPELAGWYVYGDFCSGRLWRVRRDGGRWRSEELALKAPTVSTFGEDSSGELYVATLGGDLYRFAAR
jgi:glucose/arabinose dehydrogenase